MLLQQEPVVMEHKRWKGSVSGLQVVVKCEESYQDDTSADKRDLDSHSKTRSAFWIKEEEHVCTKKVDCCGDKMPRYSKVFDTTGRPKEDCQADTTFDYEPEIKLEYLSDENIDDDPLASEVLCAGEEINEDELGSVFDGQELVGVDNLRAAGDIAKAIRTCKELFKCTKCDNYVRFIDSKTHFATVHGVGELHSCEKPLLSTITADELKEHNTIEMHPCDATESPTSITELNPPVNEKLVSVKKMRSHSCKFCSYSTNDKRDLKCHILSKHLNLKSYSCSFCQFKTERASALTVHVKTHDPKMSQQCALCTFSTRWSGSLKCHMTVVHNERGNESRESASGNAYSCGLCSYRSDHPNRLKMHVNAIHTKIKHFQCTECPFTSYWAKNIKRHFLTKHEKFCF